MCLEISIPCRTKVSKFWLGVENFVRRKLLSVENFVHYFNTKVRRKSDKIVEITAWCRKFCPTKYFDRRKFCPTKFCPIKGILSVIRVIFPYVIKLEFLLFWLTYFYPSLFENNKTDREVMKSKTGQNLQILRGKSNN